MPGDRTRTARAAGLVLGYATDSLVGDPARFHPVAGFGRIAAAAEHRGYADHRVAGARHALLLVGAATLAGTAMTGATRGRPVAEALATAVATWAVLGGRSLVHEAAAVGEHLGRGDLESARDRVTHLVGRDPAILDGHGVARAVVESVAENTSDAVVAPLLWGGLAGPAGLLGYRAANTLDAMVGHRTPRLERFGWASARLDDALNVVPARAAALLAALCAPAVGGRPANALRAWRRHAHRHPSPNAGPVEAAFAGALGVRLGGTNAYAGRVEDRGPLGDGRPVTAADVPRAARLSRLVGLGALSLAVLTASAGRRPRR